MSRVYNFSAGPACLPEEVLRQCAAEMLEYGTSGMSVMEMSHRSKDFEAIKDSFQHLLDAANQEYDAMSEEQQEKDESDELEDFIDMLEEAVDSLDDINYQMEDVIENVEDILREEAFVGRMEDKLYE